MFTQIGAGICQDAQGNIPPNYSANGQTRVSCENACRSHGDDCMGFSLLVQAGRCAMWVDVNGVYYIYIFFFFVRKGRIFLTNKRLFFCLFHEIYNTKLGIISHFLNIHVRFFECGGSVQRFVKQSGWKHILGVLRLFLLRPTTIL